MGLSGLSLQGLKVKPRDWNSSASDLRDALAGDGVQPLTQMKYDPTESATYFFRTGDDTDGILQILALVEQPKGIRIRYKALRHTDHAVKP
jgi:hypothetical protein